MNKEGLNEHMERNQISEASVTREIDENVVINEKMNCEEQEMEGNVMSHGDRILESQEINESERHIIKGDTIGETLYSAKWILKTLISLTNVYENGWNESMENELCILWDMSLEKDIVEFLLENDFYRMAELTLKISEEARLTEIIVGIIGNMCCEAKALEALLNTNELAILVLSLVSSDDPETVIQVLRVFQAALWDIQKNPESNWLKKIRECLIFGQAITFILKNSLVEDLMIPTIDIVYLISEIELPNNNVLLNDVFDIDELIPALSESMLKTINQEDNPHTNSQLKNIENWYNTIFNTMKKKLLKLADDGSNNDYETLNTVLLKVLKPYTILSNLMPSDDRGLLCIQQCIRMVYFFQKSELMPCLELIKIIIKIMINLKSAATEDEFDSSDLEYFKEMHTYSLNYWNEALKILSKNQILEVLQGLSDCDLNTVVELTKSHSSISEHSLSNFLEACDNLKVNGQT